MTISGSNVANVCVSCYGSDTKTCGSQIRPCQSISQAVHRVGIGVGQGVKLIFFSDSHLAPKFFKVVANSKKVGCHFQRQTKPFFKLSTFKIDPPKLI